jgi:hypothetical protein
MDKVHKKNSHTSQLYLHISSVFQVAVFQYVSPSTLYAFFFPVVATCPAHRILDFTDQTNVQMTKFLTERRGRVVDTPASYLGGPRFKSWPRDQLS